MTESVTVSKAIHDVRNPLNTIAMQSELGKMLVESQAEPEKVLAVFNTLLAQCRKCDEALGTLREATQKAQLNR